MSAGRKDLPPLDGFIRHHLQFVGDERVEATSSRAVKAPSVKRPRIGQANISEPYTHDRDLPLVGFFFYPDHQERLCNDSTESHRKRNLGEQLLTPERKYRIVIPQSLLKIACDASRYTLRVTIRKYAYSCVDVIDIHADGLVVHGLVTCGVPRYKRANDASHDQESAPRKISLIEFEQVEMKIEAEKRKKRKTRDASRTWYNIVGEIDAVSSIIAAIPTDPFALIELYQIDNAEKRVCTAVVVLKGPNALRCHPALQPGDKVSFINVRRQRWHVPQSFQKEGVPSRLNNRSPTHVFVVTDDKSIIWDEIAPQQRTPAPPFSSAIWNGSSSVTGEVLSVKYNAIPGTESSRCGIVHYVIIDTQPKRTKIYLTYCPISPMLHDGLKVGAVVRASNIHRIDNKTIVFDKRNDTRCYGACLRSTVVIVKCASERSATRVRIGGEVVGGNGSVTKIPSSYPFQRINHDYSEIEWISTTRKEWFDRYLRGSPHYNLSTFDRTIQLLLTHNQGTTKVGESKKKREPYAEFFDHGCLTVSIDEVDPCSNFGCSCVSPRSSPYPVVVSLVDINRLCIKEINAVLRSQVEHTNGLEIGWIASIHVDSTQLLTLLQPSSYQHSKEVGHPIFTGGIVNKLLNDGDAISSLRDNTSQVNVSAVPSSTDVICSEPMQKFKMGDLALIKVHQVIISCLFLGDCGVKDEKDPSSLALPALDSNGSSVKGSTFLTATKDGLFMVSVNVQFKDILLSNADYTECNVSRTAEQIRDVSPRKIVSISDFLDYIHNKNTSSFASPSNSEDTSCLVASRLVRQRWKIRKLNDGYYEGCSLTLSQMTQGQEAIQTSFQSVEVKVRVHVGDKEETKGRFGVLKRTILSLCLSKDMCYVSSVVNDEVLTLACAWWIVADNAKLSPVLCGGWDEICSGSHRNTDMTGRDGVRVLFPLCSINTKAKGNYFDCTEHSLHATYLGDGTRAVKDGTQLRFNYIGGRKFFPGMMDLRLKRARTNEYYAHGEAIISSRKDLDGVPSILLSGAHFDNGSFPQTGLNPFLVHKVENANLVSLLYCRARVECRRCFCFLVQKDEIKCLSHLEMRSKQKTYWHLPMPSNTRNASESTNQQDKPLSRKLCCPSGCDARYAAVKWESSGIIDDGTGQSKLYAERDATLSLLGENLDVKTIEKGAWETPLGITFQRSVPPSPTVKNAVYKAQYVAYKDNRHQRSGQDILRLLPTTLRAEFELQYYCRSSSLISRQMTFLCRYKVGSQESPLDRVEIPIISTRGDTNVPFVSEESTFLPPRLNLKLVDCIRVVNSEATLGWDILRSLKGP